MAPVVDVEAGGVIASVLPDATPARVREIDWLVPDFARPDGSLLAPVQAFLVRGGGGTVLVDTGVGDGKQRVDFPEWNDLETGFLSRLPCAPEDVDLVVCTHLHTDHVGWNTTWRDGAWRPTFPRATYVFVADEYEHWRTSREDLSHDARASFDDSVQPIVEAGRARLVAQDDEIAPGLRFVPTPGHTPFHASIELVSEGARALISGDLLHHPCQLVHPEWASTADSDPAAAVATRRRVLAELARDDTLLIGSHFTRGAAVRVRV